MSFDPRAHMRRSIRHLEPYYRAPREKLLRLDQNTNLTGRNPVLEGFTVDGLEFNQYPTRDADDLLAALESHHGLPHGSVLAGNGSDEVLDIIVKAFSDPGDTLTVPAPSYSLYPFYAALNDLRFETVPLDDDWDLDVDAMLASGPKIVLVASPNNPTGRAVSPDALDRLVDEAPGIVVVDEAYIEYADQPSMVGRVKDAKNLIVMRTFSKAYGLAGARLGWLAAHPDTAAVLGLVKPPFNVNVMTESLGIKALDDTAFVDASVAMVRDQRPRMARALADRGFTVVPSDANFLLTFPPDDAPSGPELATALHGAGIAARTFPKVPRLARSIRFTVGPEEANDALLAALDEILTTGRPTTGYRAVTGARRAAQEGPE